MNLPENYSLTMKEFLGEDYPAWQDSFLALPEHGIRVNELKIDTVTFRELWMKSADTDMANSLGEQINWIHNGFHIHDTSVFSTHPYYQAGLYYIQEPSAMTPAEILPVDPGDYILDLCAAPGGKTTELLGKLKGTGLLYANDISASRAQALRKNVEMAGAANGYITVENPAKLASFLPDFFDKILVDGPCSGEGMFRRKPDMISDWKEKGPDYYSDIQSEILISAVPMLRPGGMMVYSTCTFSEIENEGCVLKLLNENPDMETGEIPDQPGFLRSRVPELSKCCIRIMPHRMRGEGQFVCLLKKKGSSPDRACNYKNEGWKICPLKDRLYLLPCGHRPVAGIRYLMTGLHVGTLKSGKLNPTQALAQAISPEEWTRTVNFSSGDVRLLRFLRGESVEINEKEINTKSCPANLLFGIPLDQLSFPSDLIGSTDKNIRQHGKIKKNISRGNAGKKDERKKTGGSIILHTGDILILADGFPVGFAAYNRGLLKNKRNPGWRMQ